MKITDKQKAWVEHYAIAFSVSAYSLYQAGDHHLVVVAKAAAIAVFGPVAKAAWDKLKAKFVK